MARLIPSFMDDRTPPGERDVFNLLASGPVDWVAIHSLDLAPWNRQLRTEIDFVVVIPDAGILCLEVKSQDEIRFDGNTWLPNSIKRSPFKQACDGRYALKRGLDKVAPQLAGIPIAHCCVFPRAPFDLPKVLSVQPWELMDSREFRSFRSSDAFCAKLRAKLTNSIEADRQLTKLQKPLAAHDIEAIVTACVPIQKRTPTRQEEIARREAELEGVLRKQQAPILQLAKFNPRLVVSGAAGTGKTLIAMEVARRAAESGKRVALLCFNRLVGEWIRRKCASISPRLPNMIVGRAIRVAAEMAEIEIPHDPSAEFWDYELPEMLEAKLTDPDFRALAQFDCLVVDEAQDILSRPRLWGAVTHFLVGGVDGGEFVLLGDFDHQVLSDREQLKRTLRAVEVSARPARWQLSENCRNYRIIGETAVRLAGFSDVVYSGFMRPGGDVRSYDISFYENDDAQVEKLARWIKELEALGYRRSDVTLLSVKADSHSAAARLQAQGHKLRPAWQSGDLPAFASIQAYKGMENKVIILTDVDFDDQDLQRHLFYTGITRGTECVRVLCSTRFQSTLIRWLSGKPGT